jgi:hypothetical protein
MIIKNFLYYPDLKEKAMKDKYLKPIINSLESQKESGSTDSIEKNSGTAETVR